MKDNFEVKACIRSNELIAKDVYRMVLDCDTGSLVRPGQFVEIALPGRFLRRPISVCDWKKGSIGAPDCCPAGSIGDGELTLIYKTVGTGTEEMSRMAAGSELDLLMGLGNGFDTSKAGDHPLLVGGGVGTPPMYGLAKRLVQQGKSVDVILGFNKAEEVFYAEEFDALNELYEFGCEGGAAEGGAYPELKVHIATADGSLGTKGFVTDCLPQVGEYSYFYTCGPMPMLKALRSRVTSAGQYSFEERMGCGFGVCVGCSIETASGWKKVCKDGPVFDSEDILWK